MEYEERQRKIKDGQKKREKRGGKRREVVGGKSGKEGKKREEEGR